MRYYAMLLTLFSLLGQVQAQQFPLTVESGRADYNGKRMILSDQVMIEHGLGKINAGYVEAISNPNDQMRIAGILLKDNVKIALREGGELTCDHAYMNQELLKGEFFCGDTQPYVSYFENNPKQVKAPLIVKSREMQIQLAVESKENLFQNRLISIQADRDVSIDYDNQFLAKGDQASYKKATDQRGDGDKMTGILTLQSQNETGMCQLTSIHGDLIETPHVAIDTHSHRLFLTKPCGAISVQSRKLAQKLDFSSDLLIWDQRQGALTLRGHVHLNQPGMGSLVTNEELLLIQQEVDGSKQIRSIETVGETRLTYVDVDQVEHLLVCYGKLTLNHQNCQTVMESPRDPQGKVLADKQVFFKDIFGEIYADQLTIAYDVINHHLSPSKLILEGNVRILKCCEIDVDQSGGFLQYALADRVEYTPQAKEVSLFATKPNRVLFFDKVNQLQVSASHLKIRRDQLTKKDTVQGVGDVRFSFVKQELEQLQKLFPAFYK